MSGRYGKNKSATQPQTFITPKKYPTLDYPTLPIESRLSQAKSDAQSKRYNPDYQIKIDDQIGYQLSQNSHHIKENIERLYNSEKLFLKDLENENFGFAFNLGDLKSREEKLHNLFEVERYNSKSKLQDENDRLEKAVESINWKFIPAELHLSASKNSERKSAKRKFKPKVKSSAPGLQDDQKLDTIFQNMMNNDESQDNADSDNENSSNSDSSGSDNILSDNDSAESEDVDLGLGEFDNGDDYGENDEL